MTTITTAEAHLLHTLMDTDELTTAELTAKAGHRMTTPRRRKLIAARLIRATKVGRGYIHEITDEGAVWCKQNAAETTEAQVRAAYAELTTGFAVRLADLRDRVAAGRAEMDETLTRMSRTAGVHVRAEADQKTLTERDRAAALILGGTARHTILIEG